MLSVGMGTATQNLVFLFKLVPVSFMKIHFKIDQLISSVYRKLI